MEKDFQKYKDRASIALVIEMVSLFLMFFYIFFSLIVLISCIFYTIYHFKAKKIKKELAKQSSYSQSFDNNLNTDYTYNDTIENYNYMDDLDYIEDTQETNFSNNKKDIESTYIDSFQSVSTYDLNKDLDEKYLKSLTRIKDIEHETFMKYVNTTKRPSSFVVFDLETTGLNEYNNEIIQIGAIKFEFEKPIEIFTTYVKPKKNITSRITSINGITNSMVENSPTIQEVLPKFLDFIGDEILIAHNSPFDMKFLLHNLYTLGYKKIKNKCIDTLKMARKQIKEYDDIKDRDIKLESYKLEELKWRFGLDDLSSHEALADCKVCAFIYLKMINEFNVCYPNY